MRVTVYDTECNSLDTKNGFVMELAWATYKVDFLSWRLVKSYSSLIKWDIGYTVDFEAERITGLTKEYCNKNGENSNLVFSEFLTHIKEVDFVAGQNVIGYDLDMMLSNLKRVTEYEEVIQVLKNKQHLDTFFDIPYPEEIKPKALKYLALDHGYVMSNAHQAMSDVFAAAHVLSKYDINQVIEIANTPLVKLMYKLDFKESKYEEKKDRLYKSGFRWNPDYRHYEKKCRQFYQEKIEKELGFSVKPWVPQMEQIKLI